jgi:hypothetical protein
LRNKVLPANDFEQEIEYVDTTTVRKTLFDPLNLQIGVKPQLFDPECFQPRFDPYIHGDLARWLKIQWELRASWYATNEVFVRSKH